MKYKEISKIFKEIHSNFIEILRSHFYCLAEGCDSVTEYKIKMFRRNDFLFSLISSPCWVLTLWGKKGGRGFNGQQAIYGKPPKIY